MRLLLDQCLPRSTVRHLAAKGIAADHAGDLGLARASDASILEFARQRGDAIVTLDADFHALLAISHAAAPSVLRIRIEGLDGEQLASLVAQVVAAVGAEIEAGALVSVTARRIRVRMLPVA